ncbi:MAG: alpha/beta fold hydrolase [Calditrichaeota bacterium]|nr:MAG: alpha/beta fold hydrolase [Calditrichota bacterium]
MKLFFREMGEGEPLLVIHGLLGSSDNWLSVGKKLAAHHHVYLLDMRNHGKSPHHPSFTYGDMVQDVLEFMSDLSLSKANFIGHSMGGKVVMTLALQYPLKIAKAVVADMAPKPVSNPFFPILFSAMEAIDPSKIHSRKEAEKLLANSIDNPVIRGFIIKNLERLPEGGFRWRINLGVIKQHLEHIAMYVPEGDPYPGEILFVAGGKSDYIREEDQPLFQKYFPAARVVRIPEAGHWVHFDAPEKFIQLVTNFLNGEIKDSSN